MSKIYRHDFSNLDNTHSAELEMSAIYKSHLNQFKRCANFAHADTWLASQQSRSKLVGLLGS